jgi:hypothetical protein
MGSLHTILEKSGSRGRGAIMQPQAKTVSTESQETGLWLWQGNAPPPWQGGAPSQRSRPERLSVGRVILNRIVAAARWTGWIASASGLILILLASSLVLRSTALDRRISADAPAVSPQPRSTLIATRSLIPALAIELPDVRLDLVRMPPAASTRMMAQPAGGQMVRTRTERRPPPSVRRTHAGRGSPVLIPGVLTPPKNQTEGE